MVVLEASGLGLRTRRGWVFRDVDLTANAGELHAIVGAPGSGRTSLLLALAGHFPTSQGRLRRHGRGALGHVAGVHEPDPELTVAEHIAERLLLLGRTSLPAGSATPSSQQGRLRGGRRMVSLRHRRAERRDAAAAVIEGAGLGAETPLDPASRGRDLTPVQRQVLGLVLATLSGPDLIVADDIDAGTDGTERAQLWTTLGRLAEQGYAVVVTAREVEPRSVSVVHRLGEPAALDRAAEPVDANEAAGTAGTRQIEVNL
ncbi:ATP-binding cassette domain-containing protein [Micromonospora sp. RHAY321]|uniref:ATP-binding cassette domain-containing protein n=1 Tax=Micromonospora sp. RHAY321 TaxID=2944807 RepID=UPI00207C1862|nr:ATP-binding cassette domain-containing protein [Micromonospora sp. RHAY321]MCO1596070.1 ATP-binding cassette domain-containing protein [Micromonospora sp. RHAY321]